MLKSDGPQKPILNVSADLETDFYIYRDQHVREN